MREVAVMVLVLPDGRPVLQRRTLDAPRSPGRLGLFGGGIDDGEQRDDAVKRELSEETDLPVDELDFKYEFTDSTPASVEQQTDALLAHIYTVAVPHADFAVFEGDGAEAYTLEELQARTDLSPIAALALHKIFGGTNGPEHH